MAAVILFRFVVVVALKSALMAMDWTSGSRSQVCSNGIATDGRARKLVTILLSTLSTGCRAPCLKFQRLSQPETFVLLPSLSFGKIPAALHSCLPQPCIQDYSFGRNLECQIPSPRCKDSKQDRPPLDIWLSLTMMVVVTVVWRRSSGQIHVIAPITVVYTIQNPHPRTPNSKL